MQLRFLDSLRPTKSRPSTDPADVEKAGENNSGAINSESSRGTSETAVNRSEEAEVSQPVDEEPEDDPLFIERPPPVHWHIKDDHRIRSVIIFFCLLFAEAGLLPLILYFSLRWGAHLNETLNLAIITSLIGTFSGFKLAQRSYLLFIGKGHESRRPLGAGRWGFDSFQAIILIGVAGFFIPLIIGSSVTPASSKAVSMAIPCFLISICTLVLLSGIFSPHIRVPFRVSSFPPGAHLAPLTYMFTEDLCAVDGKGGVEFRFAFKRRYEESAVVRKLLKDMAIWWGVSGILVAVALIIISWTTDDTDIGYGCGFTVPWAWALLGALLSIHYARKEVRRERREWRKGRLAHRTMTLDIVENASDLENIAEASQIRRSMSIGGRPSTTTLPRKSMNRSQSSANKVPRKSMTRKGSSSQSKPGQVPKPNEKPKETV